MTHTYTYLVIHEIHTVTIHMKNPMPQPNKLYTFKRKIESIYGIHILSLDAAHWQQTFHSSEY